MLLKSTGAYELTPLGASILRAQSIESVKACTRYSILHCLNTLALELHSTSQTPAQKKIEKVWATYSTFLSPSILISEVAISTHGTGQLGKSSDKYIEFRNKEGFQRLQSF